MSENRGIDSEPVSIILEYFLDNKCLIWDWEESENSLRHFYPGYNMSILLQNLLPGEALDRDVVMIKHEAVENYYMNKMNLDCIEAHDLANLDFNYEEMLLYEKTRHTNDTNV